MRILVHSPAFLPSVGGLEINTASLAEGFTALGDEVTVVTRTANGQDIEAGYRVVRDPGPAEFLRWTRWAEVVLHQNLSLRGLWPLLLVPRPLVVAHHSWYRRVSGQTGARDLLKRAIVRRAAGSIAVSPAIAAEVGGATVVVENGFRDTLFRLDPDTPRDRDLLYVGRLVSDKGADLLVRALGNLKARGILANLTIVGVGPDRELLERLTDELGLRSQVRFLGLLVGEELARVYRQHDVLVVPSRYDEPFGIVALEGIASGCVIVGTAGGGLPAAIGPCGLVVPNGDVESLAEAIDRLRESASLRESLRSRASEHLRLHGQAKMVEGYRRVLSGAASRWWGT